jgi:hypothetical protein
MAWPRIYSARPACGVMRRRRFVSTRATGTCIAEVEIEKLVVMVAAIFLILSLFFGMEGCIFR